MHVPPAQINLNTQFNRFKLGSSPSKRGAIVGSPLPRSSVGGGFNSSPTGGKEEMKLWKGGVFAGTTTN